MCPEALERFHSTCRPTFQGLIQKRNQIMELLKTKRDLAESLQSSSNPHGDQPMALYTFILLFGGVAQDMGMDPASYREYYESTMAYFKEKGYDPKCYDPFRIPASKRWSANSGFLNMCKRAGTSP